MLRLAGIGADATRSGVWKSIFAPPSVIAFRAARRSWPSLRPRRRRSDAATHAIKGVTTLHIDTAGIPKIAMFFVGRYSVQGNGLTNEKGERYTNRLNYRV